MKLDTILNSNPEGLSFKGNGSHYIPVYFKTGYFVGLTDNEIKKEDRPATIELIRNLAEALHLKTYFFGYWKDEKTEKEYLDLSLHVENKKTAVTLGRLFKQKAIFDCYKLESFYL